MKRRGFTLIELIVVMVVMIILMAIMLPTIKSLTRNNNQKQAVNQITAMLANARTTAIVTHNPCGVVIYEDPALAGQSSTQLVRQTATEQTITNLATGEGVLIRRFERIPRTTAQVLPKGVTVGTLDDSSFASVRTSDSSTGTKCRAIIFNDMGQVILVNGLARDASMTDAASAAWNFNASIPTPSEGVSSPGVIVFNANDMKAATDTGKITNSTNRAEWVKQNADILIVNAYTGNIIR